MIPYIVLLTFLIIIILYEVYSTSEPFTQDASGNDVRLSLLDLFALLGPFKLKDASGNTVPLPGSVPPVTNDASGNRVAIRDIDDNSIRSPSPSEIIQSNLAAQEITDRLAKAVSKQVKDDLASQRATDDVYDKYAPCDITHSEAQGQEYAKQQNALPSPQPDMSEYIRKDSIPCWNCSVP